MNFININIIHASAIVAIRSLRSLRSRLGYGSVSAAIVAIVSIVSLRSTRSLRARSLNAALMSIHTGRGFARRRALCGNERHRNTPATCGASTQRTRPRCEGAFILTVTLTLTVTSQYLVSTLAKVSRKSNFFVERF